MEISTDREFVDDVYRITNPKLVAFRIYEQQGFEISIPPKIFRKVSVFDVANVYAPKTLEGLRLIQRYNVLKSLPDFNFLDKAFQPNKFDDLELIEKAVLEKPPVQIHRIIPSFDYLTLDHLDQKSALQVAYNLKLRALVERLMKHLDPSDEWSYWGNNRSPNANILSGSDTEQTRQDQALIREKIQALGVEEMSDERLELLVRQMVQRVESFLKGS